MTSNAHQALRLDEFIARQTNPQEGYAKRFLDVVSWLPKLDFNNGPWIAGGSIRRLFDGTEKESDFDIFFKSELSLNDYKAELLNKQGHIDYENEFNTTFKMFEPTRIPPFKVQLIKFYFDTPEAVLDWFDYTNCQFITDGNTLLTGRYTLYDVGRKQLRVNNIHHAVSSVRRLLKYARQGYTVCDGTIGEILQTVATNPATIQEKVRYID